MVFSRFGPSSGGAFQSRLRNLGNGSSSRQKGMLLAIGGVLILSPDTLLIRLIDLDPWNLVFVRSLLTTTGIVTVVFLTGWFQRTRTIDLFMSIGRPGLAVAFFSAIANVLFVIALDNTYVANVLVVFATAPLLAALASRLFISEQVPAATWIASGLAVSALAILFSGSVGGATLGGDLAAFGATLLLATNLTIVRQHRTVSMIPAIALSGVISAALAAPFGSLGTIGGEQFAYLVLDGYLIVPLSLSLVMLAPRHIPAPDVALIHLLETALGPIWVWLVLGEVPPATTIGGGLLLVGIVAAYTARQVSVLPGKTA